MKIAIPYGMAISDDGEEKMVYQFKIADIGFEIIIPQKIQIEEAYNEFVISDSDVDISVEFIATDKIPSVENRKLLYQGAYTYYKYENGFTICKTESNSSTPYYYMSIADETETRLKCYVHKNETWRYKYTSQVFSAIGFEYILNRFNTCILHASFIEWNNKGILFTAPSGTGKSTQASLWNRYEAAEIINGDRAAISKKDGLWNGYGLPYAGSSDIFVNKKCEISAIVVLRQGKENDIKQLRPVEAFSMIYSETIVQSWSESCQKRLINLISKLVVEVPVFCLRCVPDKSAVEILKKEIIRLC